MILEEKEYTCSICGKSFSSRRSLGVHLGWNSNRSRVAWNKGKKGVQTAWNKDLKGKGMPMFGKHQSKDTIEKMKQSHKERWQDPEFKKKRTEGIREVMATLEWKEKQKVGVRKVVKTKEYRNALMEGIERRRFNVNWQQSVLSGENSSGWMGGISNEPYPFEFSAKFKESIRGRYDYTCMLCKLTQEQVDHVLRIHHIDYNKDNLDLDNFVPLCNSCHSATNSNRAYWIKIFQNVVEMNKFSGRTVNGN